MSELETIIELQNLEVEGSYVDVVPFSMHGGCNDFNSEECPM